MSRRMLVRTKQNWKNRSSNQRKGTNKNDIQTEKGYGPYCENNTLFAGPHIYEIMCCDRTNKDNQEEEKFGSENA